MQNASIPIDKGINFRMNWKAVEKGISHTASIPAKPKARLVNCDTSTSSELI